MSIWNKEYEFYSDGITRVTDPFWKVECSCGNIYLSCICTSVCPMCGCKDGTRTLGGVPYEKIIEQRAKTRKIQTDDK